MVSVVAVLVSAGLVGGLVLVVSGAPRLRRPRLAARLDPYLRGLEPATTRLLDGAGAPLPDDLAWQPHLWRAVLSRVAAPPPDVRHAETLTAIRDAPVGADSTKLSKSSSRFSPMTKSTPGTSATSCELTCA